MTDQEFFHYQDLLSTDPVVRRLCQITLDGYWTHFDELEDKIDEARGDADYYKELYDEAHYELKRARQEITYLKEKLGMWEILKDKDLE